MQTLFGQTNVSTIEDYCQVYSCIQGGVVRGDITKKSLSLVFSGHKYADGLATIIETLEVHKVKGSFFFTGDFYRNPAFLHLIKVLKEKEHYLGAHSDKHLLYCDWQKRDSLLVTKTVFTKDVVDNYSAMYAIGIKKNEATFYLPPYEWYNDSISVWGQELGLQLVNFTSGTRSNADYTAPTMKNYVSSEEIYHSILKYESKKLYGLNGFIMLIHVGTSPKREDKFYKKLSKLISNLKHRGYQFLSIDTLLALK
ncbi:MAG: polysaccharide deacetylase family protein [Bacteroidota bacterium]